MRKVFLEELPHSQSGKTIKWRECIGEDVKFEYDDIKGYLKIIDYQNKNNKNPKLKILFNKTENWIYASQLRTSNIGLLIGGKRNNSNQKRTWKYKIGDHIKDEYNNMTIIRREDGKGYKFICYKCGFECGEHYVKQKYKKEYWMSLNSKSGCKTLCPCCSSTIVVPGINDLATITPEIIEYFIGETIEEKIKNASMYTPYSNKRIDVQCPSCGRIHRNIIINNLQKNHFGCSCMKNRSYPEGFFTSLLEQLGVKYIFDRKQNWCVFYNPYTKKETYGRYDFLLPDLKIIVEIDGGYGHGYISNRLKKDLFIDSKKDELAIKNGYKIIRIKALESNLKYMKEQIYQSDICKYINIDKVDFSICNKEARKNIYKEIHKLNSEGYSATKISETVGISVTTVCNFLKNNNLKRNIPIRKGIHNIKNSKTLKIEKYPNSNIFIEYPSVHILSEKSENDFGETFSAGSVGNAIRENKLYKGRKVMYI